MYLILQETKKLEIKKTSVPLAKAPTAYGSRSPMEPLGKVALPMVGIIDLEGVEVTRGLRPVAVGTKGV